MIKIGMCDDNLNSIKIASKLLESETIEQNLDAEISIISSNQKEIYDAIYEGKIDILFLDIDFKNNGKNGIEFARDLRKINKKILSCLFICSSKILARISYHKSF